MAVDISKTLGFEKAPQTGTRSKINRKVPKWNLNQAFYESMLHNIEINVGKST